MRTLLVAESPNETGGSERAALRLWAVAGPFVGLALGLAAGWIAWGPGRRTEPPPRLAEAPSESPAPPERVEPPPTPATPPTPHIPPAQTPAAASARRPPARPAAAEPGKNWLESRFKSGCCLCYPFVRVGGERVPFRAAGLGLDRNEAKDLRLIPHAPFLTTRGGVGIQDGGKLVSQLAGRALSRRIKASGRFTVEALVRPGDTEHTGPARIVSISYDSGRRNFTLGQERDRWVVRLRTSKTGDNGTNPQMEAGGLAAKLTHVAVTYDGRIERLYLNGREAASSVEVAGSLDGWAEEFPLVLGNEYKDSRDWAGFIGFVAFYGRALSAGEVAELSRAVPPCPSPWKTGVAAEDDFF